MTDESPAQETNEQPSKARKFIIPVLVAVVAIILVGFLASRSGLDKALLRQRLDAFATQLAERGKQDGRDIQLTYKDIAIVGSFSDRHAVILAPQLSIKPLAEEGIKPNPADNLILRTNEVAVYPKAVDLSKIAVHFEHPVDFYDASNAERKLLTVSSDTPFIAVAHQHKEDGRAFLEVKHEMPSEILLTYLREQQAEGAEEQTPTIVPVYENLKVTQSPGGLIRSDLAQDGSGLGEAEVKLSNITITPEVQPEGAITIDRIESDWEHKLAEDNSQHEVDVKLAIGAINADPNFLPYAPISLDMEANYEGAAPQTAADVAAVRAQESSIKLENFRLASKDATFTATADFVASPTDVIPVGMATVTLSNVPFVLAELRRFQLLDKNNEPMVADIAQLLTGTPLEQLQDANIDISRTRGGSFSIGKTTFEEIFATVLKNSMRRPGDRPALEGEVPPAEPAQPVKPIEEPTRG